MSRPGLSSVIGWLNEGVSDNDDLVAIRTKLAELATWLGESELLSSYPDRHEDSLDALLAYVAGQFAGPQHEELVRRLEAGAEAAKALSKVSRTASYDVQLDQESEEFRDAVDHWEEVKTALETLVNQDLLDRPPPSAAD